jgi:hypothetical protein
MEVERALAVKDWHRQHSRCGLVAVLLIWAGMTLARPSVPVSSRWGWAAFFGLLSLGLAGRTWKAWRRLRQVSR